MRLKFGNLCWNGSLFAARTGAAAQETVQETEAEEAGAAGEESWSPSQRIAHRLVNEVVEMWGPPIQALARAGRAFEGLEALLGGGRSGAFDLQVTPPSPSLIWETDHAWI